MWQASFPFMGRVPSRIWHQLLSRQPPHTNNKINHEKNQGLL